MIPTPRQQGVDGEEAKTGTPSWHWARLLGRVCALAMATGEEISLVKVGGVYELPVGINGVLTLKDILFPLGGLYQAMPRHPCLRHITRRL